MRKLYLVNEVGRTYFLDHRSSALISSIDGLGFDMDVEHLKYDSRYVVSKSEVKMGEITLELVFLKGYAGYREWLDFLKSSVDLRLFYASDVARFAYVYVESVSKGQLESGAVKSKVKLERLSLWLVKESFKIVVDEASDGKSYPYPYPYVYAASYNGEITVVNSSAIPAPVRIKIAGNVQNPRVSIVKDGKTVSSLRLILSRTDAPIIEVSSEKTDQFMRLTANGVTEDVYALQDFSEDNFLFLPPGESRIVFDPGVSQSTSCQIDFVEQYVGN